MSQFPPLPLFSEYETLRAVELQWAWDDRGQRSVFVWLLGEDDAHSSQQYCCQSAECDKWVLRERRPHVTPRGTIGGEWERVQIDSLWVPLVLQQLVHLLQKEESLHGPRPGLHKTFLRRPGECLSLRSAPLWTPLLPPALEVTKLRVPAWHQLQQAAGWELVWGLFLMRVLSSQAARKPSGLCYRHPIPTQLTPALHLTGFLFFWLPKKICK